MDAVLLTLLLLLFLLLKGGGGGGCILSVWTAHIGCVVLLYCCCGLGWQVALNSVANMGVPLERSGPPPLPSKAQLKTAKAKALAALEGSGLVASRHDYAVSRLVKGALDGSLSTDEFPFLTAPPPVEPTDNASGTTASGVAGVWRQ
jgi:hypothetical protein